MNTITISALLIMGGVSTEGGDYRRTAIISTNLKTDGLSGGIHTTMKRY